MNSFTRKASLAAVVAAVSFSANAQFAGLSNYTLVGNYALPTLSPSPPTASSSKEFEASAVTWNKDTNTLFMLGDGGGYIMQTTLTGTPIDFMKLPAGTSPQNNEFYDLEGLTFIGNNQFVMTEERYRTAVKFTYAAGTTLLRSQTSTVKLATTVGNTGLEGITVDPVTGGYIFVNETTGAGVGVGTNQNIFQTTIDFTNLTASNGSGSTLNNTSLFAPVSNIGFSALNDVYALANVYGTGSPNLLVLSHTAVNEMTRAGTVASSLSLLGSAYEVEGITMDASGLIYLVSDNGNTGANSALLVYAPVPEPESYALLLAGLAALAGVVRRRSTRV